ncbi:winged helix-turn-helix domain-containing protein, partial [Streptomyces alkaliphilus]|uniref:winged helix-turn-helix domain-containing protein n=1 Tax=Streptomyces alkaliphilus TaxID=1472722 RepID=UPI0011804220
SPAPAPASPGPGAVAVDGLVVDPDARSVTLDGDPLDLTYLEFELLAHLMTHPRRVWTRAQLMATVWGWGSTPLVGDRRTVDVHVARLRRKLGARHRRRIVTVHRVGYKYDHIPEPAAPGG